MKKNFSSLQAVQQLFSLAVAVITPPQQVLVAKTYL